MNMSDEKILLNDEIVVLHKMSIVVSTDYDVTNKHIFNFIKSEFCDDVKILNIELELLDKLEWNIDPISCYDCIGKYKIIRPYFEIVMLLCCFSIEFLAMNADYKLKIIVNLLKVILNEKLNIDHTYFKFQNKFDVTLFANIVANINHLLTSKYLYVFLMCTIKKYIEVINYEKYLMEIISKCGVLRNLLIEFDKN